MVQLISVTYKDFMQLGKRNTKTLPGDGLLAKHRYREFAETEFHCFFIPLLAVGETTLDGIATIKTIAPEASLNQGILPM